MSIATGLGSLPGTDPQETARTVFGEVPELPYLPELPARGPGADMIGRSAVFLPDLPVQLEPSGWRFTARSGADLRRTRDLLARDLDAAQENAPTGARPFKVQVAGPLTLAAGIELASGHRAVSDPGAVREIAEALQEGVLTHLRDVATRLPGRPLVLQLDEPSLPAVIAGHVSTPSGYGTVRAVSAEVAEARVALVIAAAREYGAGAAVHCCAPDAPWALFQRAGASALSTDASLLDTAALDQLGAAVDAGCALWLGLIGADAPTVPAPAALVVRVQRIWDALGFDPVRLRTDDVVLTPTCGLAGATTEGARRIMTALRSAADRLNET